ncbi:UDP-glucosyltransferase 2 [Hyalella azteca]|uniref:UDP-glucuronosyltransferase n=1 Tax=Hyalella azteca TaxID=294128 RepID=A0A979FXU8_HYAAZ|nr:UDP-glucosyltransferase 2 [Hyalella azteca]
MSSPASGGNYLILSPFGSRSVRGVFNTLSEGLLSKGHNVTFVSSGEPVTHHENMTHVTSPHTALDELDLFKVRFGLSVFKIWKRAFPEAAKMMYEMKEIIALWNDRHRFDAIIINSAANEMALPFLLNVSAPFITLQPAGLDPLQLAYLGNLVSPATLPSIILPYDNNMSLWERLVNTLTLVVLKYSFHRSVGTPLKNALMSKFPDLPDARSVYPTQSLSLFNSHPLIDGAVPLLPLQVEVGCMSCRPARPIEHQQMRTFLSPSDPRPVILFSLGSFQQPGRIPERFVAVLYAGFAALPHLRFIAKLPPPPTGPLPPNVYFSDWVPQQDVLGLEATRLFMSHCGRQSINQAMYHGVPILGLPIAFDQPRHCRKLERKRYAVVMQWEDITVPLLVQKISYMLSNSTERVLRVSRSLKAEKETGLERAVRHVEHTVEYGTDLLQFSGQHLSLLQYLLIDVLAVIVSVIVLIFIVLYVFIRCIWRTVWGKLKMD